MRPPRPADTTGTYSAKAGTVGRCPGAAVRSSRDRPIDSSLLQQWHTALTPGNGQAYTIENVSSGLYLDVNGDSPWAGTAIDTWYYNGGANQQFGGV